jgi:MYXO-CTERM domain-containing protein
MEEARACGPGTLAGWARGHGCPSGSAPSSFLYALLVLALLVAGRRESARALAGFVPDCAILCSRLLRDPRVPRRRKALLVALAG